MELVLALDTVLVDEDAAAPTSIEAPLAVLDLSRLVAQGLLTGERCGTLGRAGFDPLDYNLRGTPETGFRLKIGPGRQGSVITLEATQPRFGGVRYWFVCPTAGPRCPRRVLHLYQMPSSEQFGCRVCQRLDRRWSTVRLRERYSLDITQQRAGQRLGPRALAS